MYPPVIVCLDLEGVLVPEIWVHVARTTGIEELHLTTREVPDYDALMTRRLEILDAHHLTLHEIQGVIDTMGPLEGAQEFVAWIRERYQLLILSDTFYQFAHPLMRQLGFPALWCHQLEVDPTGRIRHYHLRLPQQKHQAVVALKALHFHVLAAGDAYNDTAMLGAAHAGFFFCPPAHLPHEFPQFPVTTTYAQLQAHLTDAATQHVGLTPPQ